MLTIFCYECIARVDDGDGKHVTNVAKTCLAMATQVMREGGNCGREKCKLGFEGSEILMILPLGDHRFRWNVKI